MAIAVHCPNPGCAKIHQVKDKYAGTRGKCPLCGSWMYVPAMGASPAPPMIAAPVMVPAIDEMPAPPREQESPRPAPAAKAAKAVPARRPAPEPEPEPVPVPEPVVEEAALLAEEEPAPLPRRRPNPTDEEESVVAEFSAEEEPEEAKPKRHFSWAAVVLLLLGMLGAAAFAVAPFLPPAELKKTEDFANLPPPGAIKEDIGLILSGMGGGVAFFALVSLLLSLITRRMGIMSLCPLYIAVLGSAVLLLPGLQWMKELLRDYEKTNTSIKKLQDEGAKGEAVPSLGMQFPALAAGAASASFFLVLTALFMHKRIWSKLLGFVFLSFWPMLVVAWVFHQTLGIDKQSLPFDIPGF
jgi:hypothetical protein